MEKKREQLLRLCHEMDRKLDLSSPDKENYGVLARAFSSFLFCSILRHQSENDECGRGGCGKKKGGGVRVRHKMHCAEEEDDDATSART